MKTVYSKLANLIAVLIVGMLLFAPMRFGSEDYLYAHPRSIRMNPGDSYALTYRLVINPLKVKYVNISQLIIHIKQNMGF